jgi:hypothetical protein
VTEPKVLKLGGRDLRCIPRIPLGQVFALATAMESGSEMTAVAQMSIFVKRIVLKEDQSILNEVLDDDTETGVSFNDLNEAIGDLMVQYSNRPLGQPSSSQRGSEPTGGMRKVVSFSRGTVRTEPTSSEGGSSIAS